MHPYNIQDEYGADVYRRAAKMDSPARLNRAAGILMRKEKP